MTIRSPRKPRITTRRAFSLTKLSTLYPEAFTGLPDRDTETDPHPLPSHRFGSCLRRQSILPAVRALAEALEAKDHYTRGHSMRVSANAGAIARRLGMNEATADELELAGELHDIGKIGVPEYLLCKKGDLTRDEFEQVNQHTIVGERILIPLFGKRSLVSNVARWHHERWDGRGGPDRLFGENIPIEARVVAVADAFDAMTSSRPYRGRLSFEETLRELKSNAGAQFDPDCVNAMMEVVGERDRRRNGMQIADERAAGADWLAPDSSFEARCFGN